MGDETIPEPLRIAIGLSLSGGLRASETLAIRRFDCEVDESGNLFVHAKVAKKKRSLTRPILVHPAVAPCMKRLMLRTRGLANLFSFGRSAYLKNVKRHLGKALDLHALRHSHISMLILEKGMSIPEVAKLMEISVKVVQESYFHMDAKSRLKDLWAVRPAA
jgi:integrase